MSGNAFYGMLIIFTGSCVHRVVFIARAQCTSLRRLTSQQYLNHVLFIVRCFAIPPFQIFEDLDALAGDVAYRYTDPDLRAAAVPHTSQTSPASSSASLVSPTSQQQQQKQHQWKRNVTIVTAAVDSINFAAALTVDRDIIVEGFVSWVGRSSMEITLELSMVPPRSGGSDASGAEDAVDNEVRVLQLHLGFDAFFASPYFPRESDFLERRSQRWLN